MTPTTSGLRPLIDGVRRALRRDASVAVMLVALSAIPLALLCAWLLGWLRPWRGPGAGPLLLEVAVVLGAAVAVAWGIRRWIRTVDEPTIATDVEERAGLSAGSLRGVLELERHVPEGTSPALARRARAELEQRFVGVRRADLSGPFAATVRRRRSFAAGAFAALTLTALLLAFASPEHTRAAWAPLASPVENLKPPPLPALEVRPGDVAVHRGTDLLVDVVAPGRSVVTLRWKMEGDVPREEIATVADDNAVARISKIEAPTEYWVEAPDGAASAHYRVTPVDPLLLADLAVDVVFPPHVGRPAEHYNGEVPVLEVPEGTQLIVKGRATRRLATASLDGPGEDAGIRFRLDGAEFAGEWTPRRSGVYAWQLRDRGGEELAIRPAPVEIVVVPDAPPEVAITYPENDTVLDPSLHQPLIADARDDFGVLDATLVSWRVDRHGARDADLEQPIELSGEHRAMIRVLLDATARGLVPGEMLKLYIRVTDNSPRRQTSTSRTVTLRLPGSEELREQSAEDAAELVERARELARAAAEAQQATTALERRTAAANARREAQRQQGSPGGESSRMDFQEAAQARQALERQEEMLKQVEAMRQNLDALEQSMARSGLRDAELQERMEQLRKLYDEMLTPEMREQMEQLRKAVEQLDPQAVQKALEEMARRQEELREQLERSAELLQQAAAEQEMNNLAQEARELAAQQEALSKEMAAGKPTPEQAKAQEDLAKRTEELSKALNEMQQKLQQQGEQNASERMESAEKQAQQAGQQMQQAAQDASRQDGKKAAESGAKAAEQLERTAQSLDQAREALANAQRDQVQQTMQQATADALALAQKQQELAERMRQQEQAGEQQQTGQQPPQPGAPQLPKPPQAQVQAGQQQQGQQQSGQQQQGQQQAGQQQGQQQQGQQGQQQQAGQQQGAQQQGQQGQQRPGQQQGGQQQGGQQQGGQQQSGQQAGQPGQQPQPGGDGSQLRGEQQALQQSLQQLGRNLTEAAEQQAGVSREVSSALARANLSMQETLDAMQRGRTGTQEAQQAVNELNRLALALLHNSQQMQQSEGGSSGQQQQLADLARQQSSLNGQSNALAPMNLSQQALSQQMQRLANEQMEIARRIGNLNKGGQESATGELDALAREAADLSRQLNGGRLPPDVLARQERLFHRLLDAGRALEKDEFEEERTAERPGTFDPRHAPALDPRLFQDPTRFRAPTAEELQAFPPGYRRMILDYFERLNRPVAPAQEKPSGR